jgi:hypothetical protein
MDAKGTQTVLQNTSVRDIDPLALIGNNDDSPPQRDIPSKVDISSDRKMVEFNDLGDLFEPLLELLDLFEVVTKLDHGGCLEHPAFVQDELTVLQRVNVTLDEEQVGTGLDREETRTRNVDAVAILEVLNGSTSSGLELCSQFSSEHTPVSHRYIPERQPGRRRWSWD